MIHLQAEMLLTKYLLTFCALLFLTSCAAGRHQVLWENDVVAPGGRDDNYTNGVQYVYSPNDETTWTVGQQFYTPDDLRDPDPIPDDRPYAGWLGVAYDKHNIQKARDGRDTRETLGVRVGCTGGCSGAETVQKFVHDDLGAGTYPEGWHNQIATEPTFAVAYEYNLRTFQVPIKNETSFDVVSILRGDLGTDITRGVLGAMFRIGYKLPDDFGPNVIEPTADIEAAASEPFRIYAYGRADSKFTLYNVFIDNHLFNSGTDLDLETLGSDIAAGIMSHFGKYRLGFQFIWRSKEFEGDGSHRFGSLVFGFDI